ncbi:hypothetical protein KY343_06935 [Candidatus Woesearchaeota archaeon]|nr:hypothetical protein [Candidatus Woesearchaeota archaeon]
MIIEEFVKGSGQYVILPEGMELMDKITDLLKEYIAEELRFRKVSLPKIVPKSTLEKAEIFEKWDQYLIEVNPYRFPEGETKGVKERYFMDPLQCLAFYQSFENKIIESPIRWYDQSGPTYRNEDLDKIIPGIKQREFHRAEFVYMGPPKEVEKIADQCLVQLEKLCIDIGLKYRIVPGDSCYDKGDIEVRDIEVFIPGYKNKEGEPWLELAGVSNKYDFQIKNFNIQSKDRKELWSGCMGIGLDRFMTAVYKNGIDL